METAAGNALPLELACLLVDDNSAVLDELTSLLEGEGIAVEGRARTGEEALRALARGPLGMLVLDERLPDLGGVDVARRAAPIVRRRTATILYTSFADAHVVREALDAGVRAVVLKDAPPVNLLEAIATVSAGGVYVDPRLSRGPEGRA